MANNNHLTATELTDHYNENLYNMLQSMGLVNTALSSEETVMAEFASDMASICELRERKNKAVSFAKALPINTHVVYTVNVYRLGQLSARYTFVRHHAAVEYIEEVTELGFEAAIEPLYVSTTEFDMIAKLDFNQEVM